MKLTGKCLDAFGDQCQYNYEEFMELPESCQNALIIDFFDSVGIYILPIYEEYEDFAKGQMPVTIKTWSCWVNEVLISNCKTRQEATNEAIEKANEIFNLNNK